MGSLIETEVWQPGRVIDKIKNQTHPVIKNYWTPLYEEEDKADDIDDEEERQHEMNVKVTTKKKNKPRNRPGGRQRSARILKLGIDSGATSHFFWRRREFTKDWKSKHQHLSSR